MVSLKYSLSSAVKVNKWVLYYIHQSLLLKLTNVFVSSIDLFIGGQSRRRGCMETRGYWLGAEAQYYYIYLSIILSSRQPALFYSLPMLCHYLTAQLAQRGRSTYSSYCIFSLALQCIYYVDREKKRIQKEGNRRRKGKEERKQEKRKHVRNRK